MKSSRKIKILVRVPRDADVTVEFERTDKNETEVKIIKEFEELEYIIKENDKLHYYEVVKTIIDKDELDEGLKKLFS